MIYSKLFNVKKTSQQAPIPGSAQVQNNAGGYTWQLDGWDVLDRFLVLGSESSTYYVDAQKLTRDNVNRVLSLIGQNGEAVVTRIVQVSLSGRAPKNDPAIFALAICASMGDERTRAAALQALPIVCRTGTHLFQFAEAIDGLRGWGRGLRRAVGAWYNAKDPRDLELQLIKYQQRNGWSHRDLLRLAHPQPASDAHGSLFQWAVRGDSTPVGFARLEAMEALKGVSDAKQAAKIISESRLPREAVPTELLREPFVWDALLEAMPMTAMIRNLATMTRVGLLAPGAEATRTVVTRLRDVERLKGARVHPLALLIALRTYALGRGFRGSGTWTPVAKIVDALDEAFYLAFAAVKPTGKRYLLGLDVSGSMGYCFIAGTPITPAEATAAMAMVTVATEEDVTPMAFADSFRRLDLSRRMRLDDAVRRTKGMTFGGTDCALPMTYALGQRLPVDAFVVYTDNETWAGGIHPAQALRQYRDRMGIDAKLIVVGMTSTGFTIADPNDRGMLDVVGFDSAVPEVMAQFVG